MEKKLDILLVSVGNTRKKVYQSLSGSGAFTGLEPPSWLALTAGYIRKNGFIVKALDANAENLDHEDTVNRIKNMDPKYVGIINYGQQANTSAPLMTETRNLINLIKEKDPGRIVILSGWNPSAIPERTTKEENCDFVIEGEGFYTYLAILQGKKLDEVLGLWWKENNEIKHTGRPPTVQDLTNELSEIAWDLLPMDKYRSFNWLGLRDLDSRNKYASIYTSLGCPFKCKFCAIHATYGERKMRFWKPEWVLKQIDGLVENYQIKNLKINDELFIFNRDHFLAIANGLIERKRSGKYSLNIAAFARVDSIKEEDLPLLKEAGFNWFELGIESGSRKVLDLASKGSYDREKIKDIVKKIHAKDIDLCANFLFGLPGEDYESMQDTLMLAFELMPAFPSFFAAMAPPGSDLYSECIEKGIPLPKEWIGYAQQGYDFLPLPTEILSAKEVLRFRDYAFNAYFRNPAYLQMIEKKFGKKARDHVEEMSKHDLKRKLFETEESENINKCC
ncbi:MAG: radical SAM protein [Nanoarchaeota archaeon]|nr:radical SAM protein [Nanoarchaeota archaeon]